MGNSSSQCWSLSVAEVFHLDKKPGTVMIKKKKALWSSFTFASLSGLWFMDFSCFT